MSAGIWYYDAEERGWRRAQSIDAILARMAWIARRSSNDTEV